MQNICHICHTHILCNIVKNRKEHMYIMDKPRRLHAIYQIHTLVYKKKSKQFIVWKIMEGTEPSSEPYLFLTCCKNNWARQRFNGKIHICFLSSVQYVENPGRSLKNHYGNWAYLSFPPDLVMSFWMSETYPPTSMCLDASNAAYTGEHGSCLRK